MDAIILPGSNEFYVVIGRRAAAERLIELAARLALRGPLLILDCGNRANPLWLARELRRRTNDPVGALCNIRSARAFTCYQVVTLLEQTAGLPLQQPVLIFDLLATFYDESVSYREGRMLLDYAIQRIQTIHQNAPVVASAAPPPNEFPQRQTFLNHLCSQAGEVWQEQASVAGESRQLALFSKEG
jgi:hypothetical protein